ncbi:MAG: ferric reductase-like transmembrane domain-containing protein [Candidatus Micrarchaeota archaeon]|nr:ferric reductase-like transmembrane domain-containing protein [Candidatus Micrarchaeota archaeon]
MQKSSALFLVVLAGVALLGAYQAFVQAPSPASAVIRFLGLSSFFLLCISLLIGPLAVFKPQFSSLIEPRRAVGLAAFVFLFFHYLLVAAVYFKFDFSKIIGMFDLAIAIPAFIIILAAALTSSDWAYAKLGAGRWKAIQRLVYVAFALSFAHFLLKANGLFQADGRPFAPNLAEALLVLLGAITIAAQIAGFFAFRSRQAKK